MTQIATVVNPNISQGPHGIGARNAGGVYAQDNQQDIIDTDCFQGPVTLLSGTTDAIPAHQGGNFIIKTGQADAITASAPTAGVDDGLTLAIYSDTAFAHTVTFSSNCIADGSAGGPHHIVTFTTGYRGQGVLLRAFNGTWQLMGNTGCAIT